MAFLESEVRRDIYFGDFSGPYWPDPCNLERYFLDPTGEAWPHEDGNDSWGLSAEGLHGTEHLVDKSEQVSVHLFMTGYPDLGVAFGYAKWDGRTREKVDLQSKGDLQREREIVYSLQGDPTSVGSFVPFADAYQVVKQFIESDGELPTCIKWGRGPDIPEQARFYPGIRRW
jgi:hypothetical protein